MREIRQQGPYHYVFSRYVDPVATVQPGETVAIYTDDAFESQIARPPGGQDREHRADA
jgi:acetamidase/formamidase